jgi:hypothetical protein
MTVQGTTAVQGVNDGGAAMTPYGPSLRGAQRRGNPCLCVAADGLLRSSP